MGTVDEQGIAQFRRSAGQWWSEDGEFAPLHRVNPLRLSYIRDRLLAHFARDARLLSPFAGLSLADIGCGGGLIAEPMARMGFAVTAVDASAEAVAVARAHAEDGGLAIDYRHAAVEDLAAERRQFDAVLALEIAEHAHDRPQFFAALAALVKPGGALVVATLNRTAKSFAFAIVGAEYVLRWLPRGTHRWDKFLRPSEIAAYLRPHGVAVRALRGLAYEPWRGGWALGDDLAVNYFLYAVKQK